MIKSSFQFNRGQGKSRVLLRGLSTACNCALEIMSGVRCRKQSVDDAFIQRRVVGNGVRGTGSLLKCPFFMGDRIVRKERLKEALKVPAVGVRLITRGLLPPGNMCTATMRVNKGCCANIAGIKYGPAIGRSGGMGIRARVLSFSNSLCKCRLGIDFCSFVHPRREFSSMRVLGRRVRESVRADHDHVVSVGNSVWACCVGVAGVY